MIMVYDERMIPIVIKYFYGWYFIDGEYFCWGEPIGIYGQLRSHPYHFYNLKDIETPFRSNLLNYITFGADPECEIVGTDNTMRRAYEILADEDMLDEDGCLTEDGARILLNSSIGVDGASSTAELRPQPFHCQYLENGIAGIERLVSDVAAGYGEYYWSVQSHYVPCGGHIHIGCPSRDLLNYELIRWLDYVVGRRLIALSGRARKKSEYNKAGKWRDQPHGIEYRTPSAVWLHNRYLTEAMFRLVRYAVEMWANGIEAKKGIMKLAEMPKEIALLWRKGIRKYVEDPHRDIITGWLGREKRWYPIELIEEWDDDIRSAINGVRLSQRIVLVGGHARRGYVYENIGVRKYRIPRDARCGIYRWRKIDFLFRLAYTIESNDMEVE